MSVLLYIKLLKKTRTMLDGVEKKFDALDKYQILDIRVKIFFDDPE